jgi:hypothetical protein
MQSFRSPWYSFIPLAFVHRHRQQEEEQENRSHEPELPGDAQSHPISSWKFELPDMSRPPQFAKLIEPVTTINNFAITLKPDYNLSELKSSAAVRYIMDEHWLLPQPISGY